MLKELNTQKEKEITALIAEAFAAPPWNDRWTPEQLHTYFLDIAGNANSVMLGYYYNEKLSGVALGRLKHWFDGVEYCIDDLCVDPKMQGKGIGSALLSGIEEYAKARHFKEVSLWTERSAPAFEFYKKNRWTESGEWVRFSITVK